jgi:hypothetical protein
MQSNELLGKFSNTFSNNGSAQAQFLQTCQAGFNKPNQQPQEPELKKH